uniref:RING-type E3 ubiquitin transferase n=1 Tax=Tetraodon nigroviridis TaxID=99883 RepID=H3C443_TETNG
ASAMAQSPGPSCASLGPEEVLREIQVSLLECKVCFEKFSVGQSCRRPRNLPCGHVLCLKCVATLCHPVLKTLECPFCRQSCSTEDISPCLVLSDMQELVFRCSTSSALAHRRTEDSQSGVGLASTALHLRAALGGWGTLVNPTGIAALGSTMAVVHDGDKKVVMFGPEGTKLFCFGERRQTSGGVCYLLDVAASPCGHLVVTDAGDEAVKVFTSQGRHVLTVQGSFQMPWGVATDGCGDIVVSDTQAGTLSKLKVDYNRALLLENQTVVSGLQHPKAVACCWATGNTAVAEGISDGPEGHHHTRLSVFTTDFQLLYHTDSFSLSLRSGLRLQVSGVAFDVDGDVIITDSNQGMVWSLGDPQRGPVLTPLVGEHLVRPVGLVSVNNTLVVLDAGDHTFKIYSAERT